MAIATRLVMGSWANYRLTNWSSRGGGFSLLTSAPGEKLSLAYWKPPDLRIFCPPTLNLHDPPENAAPSLDYRDKVLQVNPSRVNSLHSGPGDWLEPHRKLNPIFSPLSIPVTSTF